MGTLGRPRGLRPRPRRPAHSRRASTPRCRSTPGSACATTVEAKTYGADGRGDQWLRIGRAEGLRGRLARVAHRRLRGAVHRCAEGSRPVRDHAGESLRLDVRRRPRRAAGVGARHRRSRRSPRSSTSSSASPGRTARATGASASSTRSTSRPADIPRFGALGVIASMQPYHAIDDGRWAEKVIGAERIATTYAFRSLLDAERDAGLRQRLVRGPANAARGHLRRGDASHARRCATPTAGCRSRRSRWRRRSPPTRVAPLTRRSRRTTRGSLAPGKLADLVIIDKDLRKVPGPEIRSAKIVRTIVGGRTVFAISPQSGSGQP